MYTDCVNYITVMELLTSYPAVICNRRSYPAMNVGSNVIDIYQK